MLWAKTIILSVAELLSVFALPKIKWPFGWAASTIHSDGSNVVPIHNNTQYPASSDSSSDNALIKRVAQGDEQALAMLYDRYAATVVGIALKIVQQREIAEDVAQEAFWRVWQRAQTFDGARGNFAPWLFGITRNLSIDELRRRGARPQTVYDDPERPWMADLPDEKTNVEGTVWLAEQRQAVRLALRELSPEQREALELAYFSGLTQREIADKLGNPLGTIKTRVRLGLLRLRDLLNGQNWNE